MTWAQQREFFRLATDWMVCRLTLLGRGSMRTGQTYDTCSWMIGELATGAEMGLLLHEVKLDQGIRE